jgi:HSP20 family protein
MALPVRQQNTEPARRDPMADVQNLASQLGQLFEGWDDLPSLLGGDGAFLPQADVTETDDAYVVEIELPGVKKKDIDISLSGRRLLVTGERKEEERTGILRRRTRRVGRFRYEVLLPGAVDEDGVQASLEDGVLTLRVPKASTERPRRIEVS